MNDNIQRICDELISEPLLHMSLHSKELFHSNVLAWLCETYPEASGRILSTWASKRDSDLHSVQRERLNLDLIAQVPGLAPVIIENKVFSPPDESQLDRYSAKILKQRDLTNPTLILLSLTNPNWVNSRYVSKYGLEWRYVSYRELADALKVAVPAVPGFPGEVLGHYVSFISRLHELVQDLVTPHADEPIGITSSAGELLLRIRLKDAVEKLRARTTAASMQRTMEPLLKSNPAKFKAAYTNGKPLLEAFIDCRNGDRIGWQYQNDQWRLAVIAKKHAGQSKALRARRHKSVAERYCKWFDFSPISDLIGRDISKVPRFESDDRYYGYDPDFVYRYRKLPDLTVSELETLSRHYLQKAKKWIR
jgi:hypothetical protein